eukprot:3975071-Pyramimonas_sp.AAC.1
MGSKLARGSWWAPGGLGPSKEHPKNPFERGQVDTVEVQSPNDLGDVAKVRGGCDNRVTRCDDHVTPSRCRVPTTSATSLRCVASATIVQRGVTIMSHRR